MFTPFIPSQAHYSLHFNTASSLPMRPQLQRGHSLRLYQKIEGKASFSHDFFKTLILMQQFGSGIIVRRYKCCIMASIPVGKTVGKESLIL